MRPAITITLLLALAAGAVFVTAQENQQDSTTVESESDGRTEDRIGGLAFVDEVEVTVVDIIAYVTDKSGKAVTDLTKDDFQLFQDGEERPISNFQLYTKELIRNYYENQENVALSAARSTMTENDGATEDRLTQIQPIWLMIFIDNDNLRPLDRNRVLSQSLSFIRSNARPPVEIMVVNYNKSLSVIQEFTPNSDEVISALKSLRMNTGGMTTRDNTRNEFYDELDRLDKQQGQSTANSVQRARTLAFGFAEEEQNALFFTLSSIREAVNMMSGLPGKKKILYISNGLPMIPGIDLFYALSSATNDPGMISEGTRYSQTRQFDALVKNANAQGVTFYTVSASGLRNATMATAEHSGQRDAQAASLAQSNYLDSLRFMADETGGVAVFNTNDVGTHLDRIEQDFYTYYSIGYALQSSGSDKVHRVKLTIPDHPNYRLRYRRRIVEKSLESRVQDKVMTGLVIPIDDNPLEIGLMTGQAVPASETRWTVPFELTFPIQNVALFLQEDEYVGRVEMFLAARDTDGKQSDLIRQAHEVRIPAVDYEEAQKRNFTIKASLLMETGHYKVSAGLLDHITRQTGFTTTTVVTGN